MTINVLGLGSSLSRFVDDGNQTIGVNDIFSKIKVNHLVCIDKPERFEIERLMTIINSECENFYSHILEWKNYHKNFNLIKLEAWSTLDSEAYFYSNNSTFVACILAYKLGAKQIKIYGADFNNHIHLSVSHKQDKTLRDFQKLRFELEKKGVEIYCTKESLLSNVLKSF